MVENLHSSHAPFNDARSSSTQGASVFVASYISDLRLGLGLILLGFRFIEWVWI